METPTQTAANLVTTTMLAPRDTSAQRYTSVVFHESVSRVTYRVHHAKNTLPASTAIQSGVLETKLDGEKHAFTIPVAKGMVYFIEVCIDGENVSWFLEPFKRRQVSRAELAPSGNPEAK
jgi:hypothetical protein